MRIVITGSSGRVGRAIHARLAPRHTLIGLDRVAAPTTQVVCDLQDTARVRAALVGADAVVHAAALHAPQVGVLPDAEFRRVNVEGTRVLAGAAIAVGVGRFVYTSTTALYGAAVNAVAGEHAAWVDESVTPRPLTIYHETKLRAEQLLRGYGEAGALAVTILRVSRCFPEPLPLMAAHRLHRGVDLRDVAAAHERALETQARGGARLYVTSGPTPFEPRDCVALARDAAAVLRRRVPALAAEFERRGWPLPRTIDRVYDSSAAAVGMGWRAQHGFEALLGETDDGADAGAGWRDARTGPQTAGVPFEE